jgi:BrnA antitoxin of type II toxin-antitoxin system
MKRYQLDPKQPRQLTLAEARRLDATPIDYSDIPPLGGDFFAKATADALSWLKSNGRGYQTRINRILRAAMESKPPRRSRSAAAPKN